MEIKSLLDLSYFQLIGHVKYLYSIFWVSYCWTARVSHFGLNGKIAYLLVYLSPWQAIHSVLTLGSAQLLHSDSEFLLSYFATVINLTDIPTCKSIRISFYSWTKAGIGVKSFQADAQVKTHQKIGQISWVSISAFNSWAHAWMPYKVHMYHLNQK